MKKIVTAILLCMLSCGIFAADKELSDLPAEEFLAAIRRPLQSDTWGEITGRLTFIDSDKKKQEGDLRVRITFTSVSMHAQITLNDVNVYGFEQNHGKNSKTKIELDLPEDEVKPGLFDFGLDPEDLTFSFIYWDFIEELPRKSSRLNECRVMRLANPNGKGTVQVWFSAEYGFPMEAWWYREGSERPWRKLELKGAKRFENGLWFVKEMKLEGDKWKTRVLFDFAQLKNVGGK